MREHVHSPLTLHWLCLTYFEQSAKHHEKTTSNSWTIGVWEIILSSFIFSCKPTDPRRNKMDIFNSCFDFSILIPVLTTAAQLLFDFSILIPVLTTASQLLLWIQSLNSGSIIYNRFYFLRFTAKGFFLSQAVIKTSKLKTMNIFVNAIVLSFNITRGNRTQLPFLYKW